ncbi:MAG: hypothetical protein KF857_03820 [Fimbriimonadaceae bacterium]|nr:hypothetical protein [Fimbriimonadaceae bacterium]
MKKALLVGAVALVVVGVVGFYAGGRPSDEELIQRTLREAVVASKEGRANPVMDAVSSSFRYGEDMPDRREIARVVRQAKPEIVVLSPKPTISGDTATVHSDVAVKFEFMGMSMDQTVKDVDITFTREPAVEYGVLPSSKWRITQVTGPALPQGE